MLMSLSTNVLNTKTTPHDLTKDKSPCCNAEVFSYLLYQMERMAIKHSKPLRQIMAQRQLIWMKCRNQICC